MSLLLLKAFLRFPSKALVLYHGKSSVALKGGGRSKRSHGKAPMIITFSKLSPPKGDYRTGDVIFCYCNGSHLRNKCQCLILRLAESTDVLVNSMCAMWNHFIA